MSSSEREQFEAWADGRNLSKTPTGEYQSPYVHDDWCTWQAARRAQASAEPVARMEVLNPGAVTYCVTAAARQLPPGDYLLYAAPQRAPLTEDQIEAMAHRRAWRYKKSTDPHHSDTYTFNRATLLDFVRGITAAKESNDGK